MRLFFVHIPKTGGCSVSECLERIYSQKSFTFSWNFPKDLERYRELSSREKEEIVLVTGHAPFTTGESELDQLPKITFLRNPIERVKSFCQYVSEGKTGYLQEPCPEHFDLDEFLDSGIPELSNLQTKMLLGRGSCHVNLDDPDLVVEKATEALENKLVCFGLTEYFDESLMLFRKTLGWKKWPVYAKLNTKDETRLLVFSEKNIRKIRELNQLDMRVYEVAIELFTRKVQENAEYLESSLKDFRMAQDAFLKRQQVKHGVERMRSILAETSRVSIKHLAHQAPLGEQSRASIKDLVRQTPLGPLVGISSRGE